MRTYDICENKDINMNFRDTARFHSEFAFMAVQDNRVKNLAEIRTYFSQSGNTCYAALWIHDDNYRHGAGKVTGYGYDKESSAVYKAIKAAGITPKESFDSTGVTNMIDKMKEILAEYFNINIDSVFCHTAHA